MFIQIFLGTLCLQIAVSTDNKPCANNCTTDFDDFVPYLANPVKDEFDWRLLQKIATGKGHQNVIISPISLKLVLAILYEGSAGDTAKEFQKILNFPVNTTKLRLDYKSLLDTLVLNRQDYIINVGTRLFLAHYFTPLQPYQAKLAHDYRTDIVSTNFSNPYDASRSINSWIEFLTNGRIKTLVSPDDLRTTVLLAANAVYFKGIWSYPFPRNQTFTDKFHVSSSEAVLVPYMNQTNTFFYYDSKTLSAQILRLPYKGRKFGLYIILPYNRDGLDHFIKTMDFRELTLAVRFMDLRKVNVIMPQFGFDFQAKYSEVLREFGFDTLFGGVASFPGIVRDQQAQLIVSDILQKSGIDINEEGSVIYSATQVTLSNKLGHESTIPFNVTHPFLFYIEEQSTKNVLFMGKVENPKKMAAEELPSRFGTVAPTRPSQIPTISGGYTPVITPTTGPNFDIELLKNSIGSSKNVLISPSSVKISLGMLAEGAVGRASDQIYSVLGIPYLQRNQFLQSLVSELSESQPHSTLEFQNAIFVSDKERIRIEYQKVVERYYRALVKQLNFQDRVTAAADVNGFVKNATHGFIPTVLSPDDIDFNTQIILTNVLYFKADWNKTFEKSLTRLGCFITQRGCANVKFMNIVDLFYYGETPNAYLVRLEYTGNLRAMLLVIPKQSHGLHLALSDLERQSFEELLAILNHTEVELTLPRFEINFGQDIIPILQKMGIRQIFETNSNLSNLLEGDTPSIVDSFIHKTKIEVTEEGTEASALSLVSAIPLMGNTSPKVRADHPFAFFIYNTKTNSILFEGVLNEPDTKIVTDVKTANPFTYEQAVQNNVRNGLPTNQEQPTLNFQLANRF